MIVSSAAAGRARTRPENPFPGLRPFESYESALFFGRDEQCDDLLNRLARRRLVAVVGMSGSGKSSLVRAGLLPALDRGYLPSAGSSWHVAVFRPGSNPLDNLTRALASRRRPGDAVAEESADEIRALLDASSLGLAAAARRLLNDRSDSLLVVADQFEEIFRFGRIARHDDARDQAAACVDLLINATRQDDVPVYVALTMRSDYLGDCAHFTGLPEALNDSQFLVPRMTRAQLRAAIEYPIAVCGGRISPRLVQRLLHDVDRMSSPDGDESRRMPGQQDQDQLPVLQHALMRVWDVSRSARERGEPIDLPHYEQPPVETLWHALDRHVEEVYHALPSDEHRAIARLLFQRLTDRDAENREVRRPTPLAELTAVALRRSTAVPTAAQAAMVSDILAAFSADGRAFVVVNAQQDVDISHESFIRKWQRLAQWVVEESRSGRIYGKLADAGACWARGEASLYRGPELAEARHWWRQETPTELWATRYGTGFDIAHRFLNRSIAWRRLRSGLLFGNAALIVVAAVAIYALMVVSRNQAKRAETAALEARNVTESSKQQLAEANRLIAQALEAQRQGQGARAEALSQQAQQIEQQANARSVLTPSEVAELDRLRKVERQQTDLKQQLAVATAALHAAEAKSTAPAPAAQVPSNSLTTELDRLRKAEGSWDQERTQLQQQLAAASERANNPPPPKATPGRDTSEPAPPSRPAADSDKAQIEQAIRDYRLAYEALDAAAVVKVVPSLSVRDLDQAFSQYRTLSMAISGVTVAISGDTALVRCTRRIAIDPKVGTRQNSPQSQATFRMKRSGGGWIIESVDVPR